MDWSNYALRILLECGLGAGLLVIKEGCYSVTKLGKFVYKDKMFSANADFIHDICYLGLFDLEESLRQEAPAGLRRLGPWATVYEGLSKLPEKIRQSWLTFDHFYSDRAFPAALPKVFARQPKSLMDIGANTGKWTTKCLEHDPDVHVTMVDLPGQLEMAMANLRQLGLENRVTPVGMDILNREEAFPQNMDAIWMSQFLVCFGEDDVVSILKWAAASLAGGGSIYIQDTFWDKQELDVSAYCLINTSPYFTAIANGVSRMYTYEDMVRLAKEAGLNLVEEWNGLGLSHTLLRFE